MSVREPSNTAPLTSVQPPPLVALLEAAEAFLRERESPPMTGLSRDHIRWSFRVEKAIRELAWTAQRARNAMPKEQV